MILCCEVGKVYRICYCIYCLDFFFKWSVLFVVCLKIYIEEIYDYSIF